MCNLCNLQFWVKVPMMYEEWSADAEQEESTDLDSSSSDSSWMLYVLALHSLLHL